MIDWLNFLTLEIRELHPDDYVMPNNPCSPDDTPLGTISTDLKALWSIWKSTERRGDEMLLDLKYGRLENTDDIKVQVAKLKNKAHAIGALFWYSLAEHFDCWDALSLGVRKDWIAVKSKPQQYIFPIEFE